MNTQFATIVLISIAASLSANGASSIRSDQEKSWEAFKACAGSWRNDFAFDQCLGRVLHPEVTRWERPKYAEFLMLDLGATKLTECPKPLAAHLRNIGRESVRCFRIQTKEYDIYGYVRFKLFKKAERIDRLKYGL